MPKYQSTPDYEHGSPEFTGVLLVNLGTPDAPTTPAVRRFLKAFLSDPRVVEYPRLLWWLILNGVILRIRPSRSAKAYREIWTDDGSPLMLFSRRLADGVREQLEQRSPGKFKVELAMTYGEPSSINAIDRLQAASATRLLVLPLYPQYSGTTTASVFDAVTSKLQTMRWVPESRFINQ
ncbi:MAG TPA: ferrochelatase, partial [Woeseiaceae bacterium]|nr:ferrochelatase [Woeseiaceae bacterium]